MDKDPNLVANNAPAPEQKVVDAAVPAAEQKTKPFVSAGSRIHNWSTYLGIDWLFNACVGVSFAYWGTFTESGQKYWSKPIGNFFETVLKPVIKDAKQLKSSAGYGSMFMSIIAGGMFTIPPLLILENNKVKKSIVQSYDRMIYGKEKVDSDPKFKESYDAIEQAPKKDFWTGLTSRFAALSPLLAIVLIPATKRFSNKIWFDHVEHGSEAVAKTMGFSAEKSFKTLAPEEAKQRWKFIHESVAMDFGLGVPYAILHEFFYNAFANGKDKKDKSTNAKEQVPVTVEAAPSAPADAAPKQQASYADRESARRSEAEVSPSIATV